MDNNSRKARDSLEGAANAAVATLIASLSDNSAATRIRAAVSILSLGAMSAGIRAIETRLTVLEQRKNVVGAGKYRSDAACSQEERDEISTSKAAPTESNGAITPVSLNPVTRRIRRLEQEAGGEHCDMCNQVGMARMTIAMEGDVIQPHGLSYYLEPDWSTTDLACCPRCGDPNPKMSIEFVRNLTTSKEFYERYRQSIESLKKSNREAASKLSRNT